MEASMRLLNADVSPSPNRLRFAIETIEKNIKPAIELLPEQLREYWLVLIGVAALIVLLPLAWYKRRLLRRLIGLPPRPVAEEPKLDEDLVKLEPPPDLPSSRRVYVEGAPARLRLAVVAPLGKGDAAIEETGVRDLLDHVRWGLKAIAEQDQTVIRLWPWQRSVRGFPAVFHRHMHKPELPGQPSHWVLLAGLTPPRPHSFLLGVVLWTEDVTTMGMLIMDPSQWMKTLHIEIVEK
jgi:hypothetical protein